jgi:hypothetical protein
MLVLAVMFTVATLAFLWWLARKVAAIETNTYLQVPTDLDGRVNCPRCGAGMETGFIAAPRGIIWKEPYDKPAGMFFVPWKVMENTTSMSLHMKCNKAWRCKPCQMLTVDHGGTIKC